ncbi:hypothetical protein D0Z00_000618 [Geotrichum galactomycetum]|uniref:Uncharacterized protein n=1 Tax=Geotrichum galactomycetum TaxID=27317 RepID=A0ACB6V9F3_9ASCO|nr:hypothetical protein D0Z00_000618 [Geotrichum candidum]
MAQDEEISLEETNRIRVSLGLKPIPVPTQPKEAPATQDNNAVSVGTSTGSGESISLEETNKLRVSMGLKPIPVESTSTSSVSQSETARKNWEEKYLAEKKVKDEERIRENIETAREKAELRKKLAGATLGDSGSSANDTKSWLANLKKKQTEQQEQKHQKHQKAVEEPQKKTAKGFKKVESQKQKKAYDTADLKGIKVSHKLSELQGQVGDVILTLKDSSILEDGEVELESSELVEKRKLEDKLRAKRGLRANDDEDDEYKPGNVLSKYNDIIGDEEISNSGSFTLDGSTVISKVPVTNDTLVRKKNAIKESLEFDAQSASKGYGDDDITGLLGADYQEAKPVKFKKSKKKSKPQAVKKRKADDDDDIPLVDDDFDIQNALSASRQKAQQLRVKKARILTPQELADEIKNEENEDALTPQPETNGLVISSTTDFLNVIKQRAANDEQEEKPKTQQRRRREETPEEEEQVPPTIEDLPMDNDLDSEESAPAMSAIDASVLAPEEPTLSGGMADALKLLRTHGVLSKPNESDSAEQQRKKQQREWSRQLTRTKIERDMDLAREREELRQSGRYDHLSQREREELAQQSNRERDLADARDAQRSFANYKPVINIEYRDEAGRLLSTKEAYKHMSHHFHGKGPGKGRVEKQLKRDEEEKKNMAKPLFGSGSEGKRASGNAGVRLQ